MVHPFLVLDLGDDLDRAFLLVQDRLDGQDVLLAAHEGMGDEVAVLLGGEADKRPVLLAQGGEVEIHLRDVHALSPLDPAVVEGLADQGIPLLLQDLELQIPVVDEDAAVHRHLVDEAPVADVDPLPGRFLVRVPPEGHPVALLQDDLPRDLRDPDLRALRVDHDGDVIGHLPDVPDHLQGPFGGLVGGIEPHHVHPGPVELGKERHVAAPVGEGRDDLGLLPGIDFHDGLILSEITNPRRRTCTRCRARSGCIADFPCRVRSRP